VANPATICNLVTQVRSRADQLLSSTFDDETEVKPWVRDSLAQLYEQLVSEWQDWAVSVCPLSLVANQDTYSLPPDFRAMQTVYALYDFGKTRVALKRFSTSGNYDPYGELKYRVENAFVRFQNPPCLSFANCIELHYTPTYMAPLLDFSSIDVNLPRGWEEWVVLDVVQKMRLRMRLDADYIIAQKKDIETRIMRAAFRRDQSVQYVTDVFRQPRYYGYRSQLSGPSFWSV
jgi:hypothetical protein